MNPPYTISRISKEAYMPETSTARILKKIKSVSRGKIDISYAAIGLGIIVAEIREKRYSGIENNPMVKHWLKSAVTTLEGKRVLVTFVYPVDDKDENEKAIIDVVRDVDKDAIVHGVFEEKVYAKPSLEYYRSRGALTPLKALHVQSGHPITRTVSYHEVITRFKMMRENYKKYRREAYMYAIALGERDALNMVDELKKYMILVRGKQRGVKAKINAYIDRMSWAIRGSKLSLLGNDAVSVAIIARAPSQRCLQEVATNLMTYLYTSSFTINEAERKVMGVIVVPAVGNTTTDELENLVSANCATIENTIVLKKSVYKVTIPFMNFNIDRWLPTRMPLDKLEEILKRKSKKYRV
ncbi:MAG: hypothetical protein GSR78_00585 [Desulfurococcales archaeon]|nr:hypothetical protein [Desulfurococcales archaeon]